MSTVLRMLPSLPERMVDFRRRGFRLTDIAGRAVLERRASAFLTGYQVARRTGIDGIDAALDEVPAVDRGFAYEGAAFAAAAADRIRSAAPARSLLGRLHAIAGHEYTHLIHVGAGWVGLVAPPTMVPRRAGLDPLLRWLAVDGAAFSRTFFRGRRWIRRLAAARYTGDPVRDVLYQGTGRCLWFVECADVTAIGRLIDAFPEPARPELWSGVGLAATYAGAICPDSLAALVSLPAAEHAAVAQGAAFAAGARHAAGHVPGHTTAAVGELAGVTVEVAVGWTVEAATRARDGSPAAYRAWQTEIRELATRHR